jgi:RND family efflux transporter MFP subunit
MDGVVTDRPLFPGETAAAGTPILTVMDTSSMLAKLHISQAATEKLKVGGTADVSIPGFDDPQRATISLISPALDPGSTTVEVWLKLPNADGRYRAGTPVHAVLHGAVVSNALLLPPSAILPGEDGSTNVLVIGSDGTVKKRAVTIGLRTPKAVQVLSGLSSQDMVVTAGGYGLDDGTKVKIGAADEGDNAANDAGETKGAAK